MQITLSSEESHLLLRHLSQHIEQLDNELVHTDKRELQRALSNEVDSLRHLVDRIRADERVARTG